MLENCMKHTHKVVLTLIAFFLAAQYLGLLIINNSDVLPYDLDRPVFSEQFGFLQLFGYVLIASGVALVIALFGFARLWRFVFFISVFFCLTISFSAFLPDNPALIFAFFITLGKMFRVNLLLHNLAELFIYGGLAAIFVPALSLSGVGFLLVLISIYDMIAVWQTKHMVKLAKFQVEANMFTGLLIPYQKSKVAMLGGGDIGFPLIFTGVAYATLGVNALIIPIFAGIALYFLLMKGNKNKFYPAMPFISAGCFLGLLISFLL